MELGRDGKWGKRQFDFEEEWAREGSSAILCRPGWMRGQNVKVEVCWKAAFKAGTQNRHVRRKTRETKKGSRRCARRGISASDGFSCRISENGVR